MYYQLKTIKFLTVYFLIFSATWSSHWPLPIYSCSSRKCDAAGFGSWYFHPRDLPRGDSSRVHRGRTSTAESVFCSSRFYAFVVLPSCFNEWRNCSEASLKYSSRRGVTFRQAKLL